MRYSIGLPVLAAALVLTASSAHAFTFSNQGSTSSYGSTLADPGDQVRNFGAGGLSEGSGSSSQSGGFSGFRFGSGSFGADTNRRLAPPAWSTDPLYLERGGSGQD
jgi:hypothetical protein